VLRQKRDDGCELKYQAVVALHSAVPQPEDVECRITCVEAHTSGREYRCSYSCGARRKQL